jgi:hypothetical protein
MIHKYLSTAQTIETPQIRLIDSDQRSLLKKKKIKMGMPDANVIYPRYFKEAPNPNPIMYGIFCPTNAPEL